MKIKKNVKLTGLRPELIIAAIVAMEVYNKYKLDIVITSVTDGKHSATSLHYAGCAFDIRIKNVPGTSHYILRDEIKANLTSDFDVVLKSDHIHVEFQPWY